MILTINVLGIIDVKANDYSLGLVPGCIIADEIARRPNMRLMQADIDSIVLLAAKEWTPIVIAQHVYSFPVPTQQEQFSAIERAFDKHIDYVAAAHGYGRSGLSPSAACLGYAAYPNQWQAEAVKYGQWVSSCCALMIQGQADVIAGIRTMPTPDQAIAELPAMLW